MTIEEAKEQLREIIFDTESLIVGDAAKGIYRKDLEALKMAVEALEKQIPRKPIEKSPWVYHCPNCDSKKVEEVFIERFRYCCDCGQALDWSETND